MKRTWLTLGLAPAMLLVVMVLPFGLFWSSLPDPMAIHWGLGGEPNGSAPPLVLLVLLVVLFIAMAVGVRRAAGRAPIEGASFVAGLFGVGALLAGVSWLSVLANRDVPQWTAADEVNLIAALGLIVLAVLSAWLGWEVAGGRSAAENAVRGPSPTLDIAEPGSAVWAGRGFGKLATSIALGVVVLGAITWGWTAVVLVGIGFVVFLFSVVRVTVSRRGAVISLGWWGFPSWTVPMESISRAEVEMVNPMAYGGWGYRVRPGVRAVVVRAGESLRLVRDDATDLVYTVDDAERGAGLINSIIAERAR